MLKRLSDGGVTVSVRPPLVYLDHWAIRRLGANANERALFLEAFEERGTLMFSLLNALEMAGNTGRSYDEVQCFLDALGPHWLLTDVDGEKCAQAEARGLREPSCFLTDPQLFALLLNEMPAGTFRLGAALRVVHTNEFRRRADRSAIRGELVRKALESRKEFRAGRRMPPLVIPKGSPRWVQIMLLRFFIKDGKGIVENDISDLLHACVPLTYGHIVALDKAWSNFGEKLKLRETLVFSQKTFAGLLTAVRSLRTMGPKDRLTGVHFAKPSP